MKKIILTLVLAILASPVWANVPNATPLFNQYTCNSSTTQFSYGFPITATSDMTVYLTDTSGTTTQLSNSVFSVDTTNLWVNYPLVGSPCATNYVVTLRPSTPQTQTTTYGARTPFTATAVGASFDKLTLISQQLQGQINRTFLQPANVTTQVTFPSSSPGNYIGWNGSGVLVNIPSPANAALWTLSGANAVYNSGNVSATGTMTATGGFVGNVTGNITGTAATVTSASQPSITSTGTLTSLLVSGNVGINSTAPGQLLDIQGTARATTFSGNGTIPVGGIIMWSGTIASIPSGWALCNGSNGTPDLRNRFVVAADADAGGLAKSTITGSALQTSEGQLPSTTVTISQFQYSNSGGSFAQNIPTDGNASGTGSLSGSFGTGTANVARFYALAFIQRTS